MATTIKLKNSVTTTNVPSSLEQGEVAVNVTDKKVWVGNAATTPVQLLGTGADGNFSALTCTTLAASGVATFSAGTVSAPAITTTGDTNTGIFFPAADTIAFTEGGAESMRIDSSGNVGIGTSSPTVFANKNLEVNGTGDSSFNLGVGGTHTAYFYTTASSTSLGSRTNIPLVFNTNNAERMRIDSSGNVLIGQTARGVVDSNSFNLDISSAQLYCNHASGVASGTAYVTFGLTTSTLGSITQNSTTGVLYNITSDQRLKTNIVDCPTGNIDDVKVRSFDWKSDGSHVEYGFIAQELVEIAPYAVHQPQNPEEMMAVDYSKLVPMMIKEIQDLRKRVAQLESK
jgi:hypothetical protein